MPDKTPTIEERMTALEARLDAIEAASAAPVSVEETRVPIQRRGAARGALFHTSPAATEEINKRVASEAAERGQTSRKQTS